MSVTKKNKRHWKVYIFV